MTPGDMWANEHCILVMLYLLAIEMDCPGSWGEQSAQGVRWLSRLGRG